MHLGDQSRDQIDLVSIFGPEIHARLLAGKRVSWIPRGQTAAEASIPMDQDLIVSVRQLQDKADYRAEIREVFSRVRTGGIIIILVPHAFLFNRQLSLPSRDHPRQRRLYTPAALLAEVEETLSPNTYRVRWAGDLDQDTDYRQPVDPAIATGDVGLILERIALPAWQVIADPADVPGLAAEPDFSFEPRRTRIETVAHTDTKRILAIKLDHIGDFLLGLPAIERLRQQFPASRLDLVVGSWNVSMARSLGVADTVVGFDAFPRNSSEEEPNVEATVSQFRTLFTGHYDLAIDLRVDVDTRTLLRAVDAKTKAGIGSRARFPFLDIHLPLDHSRNDAEKVRDDRIPHSAFALQGSGIRRHFGYHSDKNSVERDCAIAWGPFLKLVPGEYIFDFFIDLEQPGDFGMLRLDVALDGGAPVSEMIVTEPTNFHLPFRVDQPDTVFEARIWAVDGQPSLSFGFYGGRLIRRAPADVLHQSEYPLLLVELAALRLTKRGMAIAIAP